MSNLEYHSAIYRISPYREIATRITFNDYNYGLLPRRLEISELAKILSKMQEICFHDKNKKNKNTQRIIDLFLEKKNKTFIVGISLGYSIGVTDFMNFSDGGAATVQKSNLDFLKYQQPWINEVCRSKINNVVSDKSPVTIVMEMIEKYVELYLMKNSQNIDGLYLYVEKNPDHGEPDFLLKYYEKYGFKLMAHEDPEYFYMYKQLKNSPSKLSRNISVKKSKNGNSKPSSIGSLEKIGGKSRRSIKFTSLKI
jgi:hypothetical protein